MRLRDRITNGIRAVFHNLLDRDTHVPEEDRLATDIEVAQARLAQQQELWVDTNARQQEAATAWQQAQARVAEVQQRLDAATRAGNSVEAESLQAECTQMQTLAQELGRHVTRLRQSATELQAEERALQQRIARGRQRLAKLAQEAARAPAAVSAAPAPSRRRRPLEHRRRRAVRGHDRQARAPARCCADYRASASAARPGRAHPTVGAG